MSAIGTCPVLPTTVRNFGYAAKILVKASIWTKATVWHRTSDKPNFDFRQMALTWFSLRLAFLHHSSGRSTSGRPSVRPVSGRRQTLPGSARTSESARQAGHQAADRSRYPRLLQGDGPRLAIADERRPQARAAGSDCVTEKSESRPVPKSQKPHQTLTAGPPFPSATRRPLTNG